MWLLIQLGARVWKDSMLLIGITLIALVILIPAAIYARTLSGIIIAGITGGAIMAGGCFLLKFFAGVDKATSGRNEFQKLFDLAIIVAPIVLFCYFMVALLRLNERKRGATNNSGTDQ
jgi:hypothetical protein